MINLVNVPRQAPRRVQHDSSKSVVHYHFILWYDFLWRLPIIRKLPCTTVHEYKHETAPLQRTHNKLVLDKFPSRPYTANREI